MMVELLLVFDGNLGALKSLISWENVFQMAIKYTWFTIIVEQVDCY